MKKEECRTIQGMVNKDYRKHKKFITLCQQYGYYEQMKDTDAFWWLIEGCNYSTLNNVNQIIEIVDLLKLIQDNKGYGITLWGKRPGNIRIEILNTKTFDLLNEFLSHTLHFFLYKYSLQGARNNPKYTLTNLDKIKDRFTLLKDLSGGPRNAVLGRDLFWAKLRLIRLNIFIDKNQKENCFLYDWYVLRGLIGDRGKAYSGPQAKEKANLVLRYITAYEKYMNKKLKDKWPKVVEAWPRPVSISDDATT
jgi:hypothetical protein